MNGEDREDRRAYIRRNQIRIGVALCIAFPTVSAYFQPDPTPSQTLRSFGIRVLEAAG